MQKNDLPPKVTFALKVLLLYVLVIHRGIFTHRAARLPFLPFLDFFDSIPSFVFSFAAVFLFLSILTVLLKKGNYQILSLTSGLIILAFILSSKLFFSNSLTFTACLLVLIGLSRGYPYIFRIQISLLYLGAAINKIFDPDWWNGHYFDFFLRNAFDVSLYQSWVLPNNLSVAKAIGITTIFSELFLGIMVLIPKLTRATIILGLIFHGGMLVVTSGELSTRFLYIMSAAFLLISNLNLKSIQIAHRSVILPGLLSYLDLSDSVKSNVQKEQSFSVTIEGNIYSGANAWMKLLLSTQFLLLFYFMAIILYMITPFLVSRFIMPALNLL